MKKTALFLTIFLLISCWKNNQEGEQYYTEDKTPIDTTLVDSVVGQASFTAINSAIENAKRDTLLPKKDTVKTAAQKLADAKKKLEETKKKTETEKKLADQKAKDDAEKATEKEKQQQEKKVDELVETPEN